MKKFSFALVVLMSLFFVGCNKDGDILVDNPSQEFPSDPEGEIDLGYSVLEYTPAPGQYINDPANGSAGINSPSEASEYAMTRLKKSQYVSLGAWGGYIVVKFSTSIENSGDYDFAIKSNSFETSNEPGIVWVMSDTNKNGLPDDEWYELKGSFFKGQGYERNYWVTYQRPENPGQPVKWTDKNGKNGEIQWLGNYHSQDYYYPEWILKDYYTLYGSLLPDKAIQDDETGLWNNEPYEWGYADNFGSDFIKDGFKNQFRISDAVTSDNQPALLSSIDFIKVQTAVLTNSGWLGEISTEVSGFFLLH